MIPKKITSGDWINQDHRNRIKKNYRIILVKGEYENLNSKFG